MYDQIAILRHFLHDFFAVKMLFGLDHGYLYLAEHEKRG